MYVMYSKRKILSIEFRLNISCPECCIYQSAEHHIRTYYIERRDRAMDDFCIS